MSITQPLIINPRYKPVFVEDSVMMLDETTFSVLSGNLVVRVMKMIQQDPLSRCEVAHELREEDENTVTSVVDHLIQDRFVIEKPDRDIEGLGVWQRLGLEAGQLGQSLQKSRIAVRVAGAALSQEQVEAAFRRTGLLLGTDGDMEIVVADHPMMPVLQAISVKNQLEGKPWLLVCLNGSRPWIGPIFNEKTACYHCLYERLCENRMGERFAIEFGAATENHSAECFEIAPTIGEFVLNAAAIETLRWVTDGKNERLEGSILEIDIATWQSEQYNIIRRPSCAVCDHHGSKASTLRNLSKETESCKGFRVFSVETLWESYKHLVNPVTGIVRNLRRLYPICDEPAPFYVYGARYSLAHRIDSLIKLKANTQRCATGKGSTELDAKISALCEAFERYSGLWADWRSCTIRATACELGADAVSLEALLGYSDRQYDERQKQNADHPSITEYIPRRLGADESVEWSPVWSITRQTVRWVPSAYLFYDYPCPDDPYCCADSNGNAAGGTLPEAVLQGLFELLERDAVAIWWYNRINRPGVDLQSLNDPFVDSLLHFYRNRGRELWVLDLTNDLNIPAFIALSRRIDREPEDIIFGASCHVDPTRAILGALQELNQLYSNVAEDGEAGTAYLLHDPSALRWFREARVADLDYLLPSSPQLLLEDIEKRSNFAGNTSDDLKMLRDALQDAGFEVLVHDQTRPDVGLPVAKVMVPGLIHWWRRFGNSRLYRVPQQLGWLDTPRSEEDLNPYSIVW